MSSEVISTNPLDEIYNELSAKGFDTSERRHYPSKGQSLTSSRAYSQFPVYRPKCSSEYYSTKQNISDKLSISSKVLLINFFKILKFRENIKRIERN